MTDVSDEERRAAARALWARGDYATFGDLLAPVGAALCARIGVSDLDVLDVGTGTGSTALAAAGAGGRVSGVDLTPQLLAVARRRAEVGELPVEWREDDAVPLPYGRRVQLDPGRGVRTSRHRHDRLSADPPAAQAKPSGLGAAGGRR